MMQVILNEQGFVDCYALVGSFGSSAIAVDEPADFEDFEKNYQSYYLSEGSVLVKNIDKQIELEDQKVINSLRLQRAKECFSYINRGELWYERLTVVQKEELNTWYQAWLDVTETKVIPEAPEWLE